MSHARHRRLRHQHSLFSNRLARNPHQCVELARSGLIRAVSCRELIGELTEKLEAKLAFSPEQTADTLADFLTFLPLVNIPRMLEADPRDAEDNAVLECAIAGQAQFIISGDLDLLVLKNFREIEIVRAADFLARWKAGKVTE